MPMLPSSEEWSRYWSDVAQNQRKYTDRLLHWSPIDIFAGMIVEKYTQKNRTKNLLAFLAPHIQNDLRVEIDNMVSFLENSQEVKIQNLCKTLRSSKNNIDEKITSLDSFLRSDKPIKTSDYHRLLQLKILFVCEKAIQTQGSHLNIAAQKIPVELNKLLPTIAFLNHKTAPDYNEYTAIPSATNVTLRKAPQDCFDHPEKRAQDVVLDYAQKQKKDEPSPGPLVLNLANARSSGGNPFRAAAQEEDLCQDSTAMLGMVQRLPNKDGKWPDASNERDFGLSRLGYTYLVENCTLCESPEWSENPQFGMIVAAAPSFSHLEKNTEYHKRLINPDDVIQTEYRQVMAMTMRLMFDQALQSGRPPRTFILGALGCGVFRNNPWLVAALYRTILSEEKYKNIPVQFAIYEQGNPILNTIFKSVFEADAATVQEILETAPCCQVKKELSSQFNTRSQTIEKLPIFYCGATWAENKKAMEAYGPMFSMRPHSSLKITAIETAPVKTTSIPAIKTNKKINWPMIGLALLTGILPVLIVVSLAALFKKKSLTTYFREVFYLESKQSSGSQTDSEKKTGLAEAKIEKEQPALISSPLSTPKASITTASPSDHPENSKRAGEIKPDTL